jgi:hypothetical protein
VNPSLRPGTGQCLGHFFLGSKRGREHFGARPSWTSSGVAPESHP